MDTKTATPTQANKSDKASGNPPGFFARLLNKLDASLKQRAEAKPSSGCCGGESKRDEDKGGKCCS
jgi:hypothetical protein